MPRKARHSVLMERVLGVIDVPVARKDSASASYSQEEMLILRARNGEESAFNALVESYQARVFSYILSKVRNRQTAEDLTQEVLVKAFFNLPKLRDVAKFKSWVFSIAHNHLKDTLRRSSIDVVDTEEYYKETYVDDGTPENTVELELTANFLQMAFEKLTPEQKEVLTLCDLEGLSYKEIAKILGIPLGTVQSRIFYARKKLKEILEREFAFRGEI